jgi:hypothetical protein
VTGVGRPASALLCAALLVPGLAAQGYRLRLETRAQGVSYRGVTLDSIPAADAVTGPSGGPTTPDGYAVRCVGADPYCTFFRPGPERRAGPLTTLAALSAWGLGAPGISAHATARLGVDLGASPLWPGTRPALQLLEGYAQYAGARVTARLGRQLAASRLGTTGFDGAQLTLRDARSGLEVGGYVGSGLDRGAALPVTSPALNPLDDFQPRDRQIVAGLGAGWTGSPADVRVDYLREVDPGSDYFVSERVSVAAAVRPLRGWNLTGGADYDLAAGWWGSADATLGWATRAVAAAVGVRRYRPHFDLWTIWGAFSPVPHRAVHGRLAVRVLPEVQLRARGERYEFDDAAAETPLVSGEREGWRWEVGGTAVLDARWTIDLAYHAEFGPGAASDGPGASVTFAPAPVFRITLHGASLDRPLELRYSDAALRVYGLEAQALVTPRVRATLGATRHVEERDRPDAGAFSWNQMRVTAGLALELGPGADGRALPVIRRMPRGPAR